jgi:phage recombination protein Bet
MAEEKQQETGNALVKVLKSDLVLKSAETFGLDANTLYETLFRTVFPRNNDGSIKGTLSQFVAFLSVARQYNLNPFVKEIYAFPSKGGGVVPIVPVDGWVKLIQTRVGSKGETLLDGLKYKEHIDKDGKMVAITCIIKRKDMSEPVEVTEYMEECVRETEPWKKCPRRMLRHKATIQCGRMAFGLSGIYDLDEAERIIQMEDYGQNIDGAEIQMPKRIEKPTAVKTAPEIVVPPESKTRTQMDKSVEEKLGGKPTIEDFATGKVSRAIKEVVEDPLAAMQEVQTGHPAEMSVGESEASLVDEEARDQDDDDFDVVVPAQPAEPEKKLKKDMTSAEQHLGPVYGEDKSKWPTPKKVLTGDYDRVQSAHTKKLHIVLSASKRTEKELYEKLWKEWGIESTKDIPRESYPRVLDWITGNLKKEV